jgi:hypothetical protein
LYEFSEAKYAAFVAVCWYNEAHSEKSAKAFLRFWHENFGGTRQIKEWQDYIEPHRKSEKAKKEIRSSEILFMAALVRARSATQPNHGHSQWHNAG